MRRPLASWRKLPLPTPSRHNLSPSPPFSRRTQPLLAVHRRMEQLRLHLPAPLSVVTPSTFPWTPPSPSSKAHRAAAPSFPVDPWCWEFFPPLLEFVAAFPCTGSSHGRPPFFLAVPGSSTPTQGQRLPWPPAAARPPLPSPSHGAPCSFFLNALKLPPWQRARVSPMDAQKFFSQCPPCSSSCPAAGNFLPSLLHFSLCPPLQTASPLLAVLRGACRLFVKMCSKPHAAGSLFREAR
jgi:hypothetical protein